MQNAYLGVLGLTRRPLRRAGSSTGLLPHDCERVCPVTSCARDVFELFSLPRENDDQLMGDSVCLSRCGCEDMDMGWLGALWLCCTACRGKCTPSSRARSCRMRDATTANQDLSAFVSRYRRSWPTRALMSGGCTAFPAKPWPETPSTRSVGAGSSRPAVDVPCVFSQRLARRSCTAFSV